MSAKVRIPAPLRKLTQDKAVVDVDGATVQELIVNLDKNFPGLKNRICEESGQIRRFVNIFVDGEDIRFKGGPNAPIVEGAEVAIIPAIAGGRSFAKVSFPA